jgi:hypothetical protein
MAGIPKVRIQFDADFDELKKGVKGATNEVESFGDRVGDFAKKAGAAFALAGIAAAAYAGKLLIDGVKSAIEDEAAQAKLAATLENVTGATNAQIKATEDYITKTQLAFGVTDTDLRPSLERLVRATKDVEAAQKLQTLALDISAGSGKSLEAVSNALGKAYEGNTGALGKLGVGLGAAELKTMSMDEVTKSLAQTFGGQAAEKADTFSGKMARLKVALDEAKESVGAALLPEITKLVEYIAMNVVPQINAFVSGLTGDRGARNALDKTAQASFDLGDAFRNAATSIGSLFAVFNDNENTGSQSGLAKVIGWAENIINIFNKLVQSIAFTFGLIKTITNPKNWLLGADETVALANQYAGIVTKTTAGIRSVNRSSTPMNIDFGTVGGSVSSGSASGGMSPSAPTATATAIGNSNDKILANIDKLQKEVDMNLGAANKALDVANAAIAKAEAFFPISAEDLSYRDSFRTSAMNTTNITVNGAIDSEGTARQIIALLNNSYYRGTQGAGALIT